MKMGEGMRLSLLKNETPAGLPDDDAKGHVIRPRKNVQEFQGVTPGISLHIQNSHYNVEDVNRYKICQTFLNCLLSWRREDLGVGVR